MGVEINKKIVAATLSKRILKNVAAMFLSIQKCDDTFLKFEQWVVYKEKPHEAHFFN